MAGIWDQLEGKLFGEDNPNKPGLISDIKRGTGQVIQSAGSTLQDIGAPNVGAGIEQYGAGIVRKNPSQINTVGEALSSPLTTIRESVGEVIPQIGTSVGAGMAGRAIGGAIGSFAGPAGTIAGQAIGGAAGTYLGNLAQSYGGIRAEQREQGIEDKGRAFATGAASAGLDTAFGAERVVNKFLTKGSDILAREAGTSLAKQVGKQTAIGFGTEALTETGQTALERYGAFKELTGDEALNEYGLSAIKGGIGGGVIRGGLSSIAGERTPTGGNDIQQAFSQPDVSGTPINNIAPPIAPLVQTPAQTAAPSSVETSVPVPPAVTGGTTDIAQAQQQTQADLQAAQIEEQQIQQAQALQAQRDEIGTYFGAVPAIENGRLVGGTIFGKSFADPEKFNAELDKLIKNEEPKTPVRRAVEKAFMDSLPPEKRKLNTIQSGALQFWANKPDIAAAAESINTAMSDLVAKGKGIDDPKVTQFAQMYEALTGSEAPAYEAATKVKPKGAKDGKLPLQTTTGLGTVPVEGGTGETTATADGTVQPSGVQSVQSGSVPEGSLGLQTGQLSGEGIRSGTSADANVVNGNAPSQVIGAPNEQAVQSVDGGGQAGQSTQANQPNVDQQPVQAGARPYDPRISFYSTDLSHISGQRRIEIISDLLLRVLAPKQERKNTVPAATRAEILRLALLEQFPHKTIAELTGVKVDTVEKQLERMGVQLVTVERADQTFSEFQVVDPAFAAQVVEAAAAYRSPEFPDGIGQGELSGLYNTRYEGDEETATTLAEEIQAGEQEGKAGAKLQEELRGKEDGEGKSMGTVATAGGSQGAVDSAGTAFFDKVEKLQAKLEAMPPQDPRRKAAAEQLQKLWADYAKGQEKRRAKGEADVTEEGDEDAVQEPSAEEVPVREGAAGGKAVGKGNAKRGKAAAKAEVKPEPKQEAEPEEVKTPAEEWAEVSKLAPELPPYDVLKKTEKSRWDDLVRRGQANLAAAVKIIGETTEPAGTTLANEKPETTGTDGTTEAVDTEVNRILRLTRGDTVEVTVGTLQFDGQITDEASLRRFPGVDSALSHYENNGLRHVLDKVQLWMVAPDTVDFDAAVMLVDGKQTLAVRSGMLVDADTASWSMHHEIGHVADEAFTTGGILSSSPELNLTIKNGQVKPMGAVVSEVMTHMAENPDSEFTRSMGYPLNHSRNDTKNMTSDETRMEVFAQLWAFFNTRIGNEYLADNLPLTYDFMEASDEAAKQNKGDANAQTGTTATTATPQTQTDRGAQRITPAVLRIGKQSQAFTADQVIGALPKPLQKSAREQWTNIKTLAKRGLYASAITEDVISLAKKYMPSAAKYLQAQYARQGTRLEFEKRIEDILGAFDRLPENLKGTGKGSVNEYIHDSTREKKWGYYPGEQQIGTTLFEVDPDLEKRFKAFPPAAQRVIKDVFRHGYEALKLKQKAAENAVNREFESREKAAGNDADLLQSIAKEKKQMLKRITSLRNVDVSNPYAYLGRYGDYVVIAKSKEFIAYEEAATGTRSSARSDSIIGDPQQAKNWLQDNVSNPLHYVVQFAETQGEADSIAEELQATGQYDIQPEDAGIKEVNSSYMGGSDVHMAVARLRNLANRQTESTDSKLDKAISDLYLMTVAEASARRSELERKNVSGADKNMMRNLATSGRADAHFLATMEHSDELNDALEAMRDQARNNRKDAMPLYNELYTRYADSMEYSQPSVLAQNLLRMSTLWNLSTSPAYYLQQVLQTSVLSLPYMAGRLGYFRSARAIKRAYGDMSALVQGLGINDHIDFDKAPADVRFMLKELVRMGKIDIGIDADAKARTDDQGPLGKVMFKLQGINTRIEAINRATAAIAAYRGYVDRYKGATGADGVRFAAEVVSNTHGNYDGFNTPRVMQSGGAKVLLQFKRFQIIQLSMLAKLIHTSFKGANAEERAIARASLKYITAHMAVLGGALGVPFVSQAASILSSVFGDDEEPDDYEYKLRRMIGNDAVADLLLRGVPAALGLESIGKRLSMENVASPFGPFVEFNITSRADAAQMIVGMMGPSVGLGLKFVDALGMMSKGDYYKGLELALPNGIANVMKGYRFANEGITMRNGDLVMKPEDISMIDAAFQAVGLPTTTITDRQYTQKVVAEFDKFYASRAGEIKGAYVEASRQSDAAAMAEARDDWQKLQESRVKNGYKRQPMSELFRAPVEARKRERGVVGGVETTKSNRRFVEQQVNQ